MLLTSRTTLVFLKKFIFGSIKERLSGWSKEGLIVISKLMSSKQDRLSLSKPTTKRKDREPDRSFERCSVRTLNETRLSRLRRSGDWNSSAAEVA